LANLDSYQAILDVIANVELNKSSKEMKKTMTKLNRAMKDIAVIEVGLHIDKKEVEKISSMMKALQKTQNISGLNNASIQSTQITPFVSKDEKGNTLQLANVMSTYKNELGQVAKVTGILNRETQMFTTTLKQTMVNTELTEKELSQFKRELELSKKEVNALVNSLKQYGTKTQHTELDKLNKEVRELGLNNNASRKDVDKMITSLKDYKRQIRAVGTEARSQGKASLNFGEQLKNAVKGFGIWSAVTVAYYKALEGIKKMVMEVKALDDSMVELLKVTDLSTIQLENFAKEASVVGKTINSSAAKIIQASADFARMGFSEEASMSLGKDAIILTKIADGITDVSQASTAMISILKGFNMEAGQSRYIIDSINEVSNNFAINTNDLADGLRRTAGVMRETNVSFEDTIGLLIAGQESLQNIEKVSSGLITITTRLRGVTESGEEIDGLMPKLQSAFKQFAEIDIQKPNGELKNTVEILKELEPKWSGLNDEQRSYLSFLISGTRQSPVFLAMMSNLKNGMEASATATDSAGSAMEEFRKYSESLQGKLDELGATWSRISSDFISGDFLKGLLNVVNGFSRFAEVVGLGKIAIIALSIAIGAKYGAAIISATMITNAFTVSIIGSKLAIAGLFGLIAVGVIGAVVAIDLMVETQKELNKAILETNIRIKELEQNVKDLNNEKINIIDPEELKMIEKEIELTEKLLKLNRDKNAKNLNKLTPKNTINSENIDSQQYIFQMMKDPSKSKNLILDLKMIDKRINEINKSMSETQDEETFFNLKESLSDVENLKSSYSMFALEFVKNAKSQNVSQEILSDATKRYIVDIFHLLGLNDDYHDNFMRSSMEQYNAIKKVEDAKEGLTKTTNVLSSAISNFIMTGELGEENLISIAKWTSINSDEVARLASAYGASADEIKNIQKTLTNILVQETRKRMQAIAIEYFMLEEKANNIMSMGGTLSEAEQRKLYGAGSALGSEMMKLDKFFAELDKIEGKVDKKTEDKIKSTKEYSNQLRTLNTLLHELEMLESKASVGSDKLYDNRIAKIKEIQEELHNLNNADKIRLSSLKKGTEDYDKLLETINSRSVDWYNQEKSILAIKKEQNDALKELEKTLKDINKTIVSDYQKSIEKAINIEMDGVENLIEENKIFYKGKIDSIDMTIDSLKLEKDLQSEIADILEIQNDLLKAKEKLSNVLKEKNTRVVGANGEFEYVANPKDVREASEDIIKIEKTLQEKLSQQSFNAKIRDLETEKNLLKEEEKAKEDSLKNRLSTMKLHLTSLKEIEAESYLERLEQLKEFINSYNLALKQLGGNSISVSSATLATANSLGFGSTATDTSKAYYDELKEKTGGDKQAMINAEIERAQTVIASRKSQNLDTTSQQAYLDRLKLGNVGFAGGGINDFTGIANLHGTKSRPEMVLNNSQSAGLFNWIKSIGSGMLPNLKNVQNSRTETLQISNLNITASSGDHLSQLLSEAKSMVRNGFAR